MSMDRETIIKLAREAGWPDNLVALVTVLVIEDKLADLVKLAAEHEREALATYFEGHWRQEWTDEQIAAAIRARGHA